MPASVTSTVPIGTRALSPSAFRRLSYPTGNAYSHEYEIVCQILYGKDLSEDWKRLVIIKEALHKADGNKSMAARALGIHRNTLSRKIGVFKLDPRPHRRRRG